MGNTIRREPIVNKIPDSPDYKFLNITNFGGISQSDNPFILKPNTASDMLNLYVDESNTLTTRPRLQEFIDLTDFPTNGSTHVIKIFGVYPLSNGFLIYCLLNPNTEQLYIYTPTDGTVFTPITKTNMLNRTTKWIVFEQDDLIYFLDGNGYYVIDPDSKTCKPVEGYVPTVTINASNTKAGAAYEQLNLLSTKYKETYIWDGTWALSDIISDVNDVLDVSEAIQDVHLSNNTLKYIPVRYVIPDDEIDGKIFWGDERIFVQTSLQYTPTGENATKIGWLKIMRDNDSVTEESFEEVAFPDKLTEGAVTYGGGNLWIAMTPDGLHKTMVVSKGLFTDSNGIFIGESPDGSETFSIDSGIKIDPSCQNPIDISDDGKTIAAIEIEQTDFSTLSGGKIIVAYWNETTHQFDQQEWDFGGTYSIQGIKLSGDGKTLIALCRNATNVDRMFVLKGLNSTTKVTPVCIDSTDVSLPLDISALDITKDGTKLAFYNGMFTDLASGFTFKKYSNDKNLDPGIVKFSSDEKRVYVLCTSSYQNSGWYDVVNEKITFTPLVSQVATSIQRTPVYATNSKILRLSNFNGFKLDSFYFNYASEEPNITVTRTLSSDDERYKTLDERRNKFLTANLSTRFDNERWFAAGNTIFKTLQNNPTYIGVRTYTELGETDDYITGFNLIQDNLLVVYKQNRLWAISPYTYTLNGKTIYDYTYQETKNTIGNNAIGGSIVTAYSELPIQITYDGVYALRQLTNVYASDRISESISDGISLKWTNNVKENGNESIKKAITLNRKYWTYIIMRYALLNVTKVFLLDNRTLTWYYWELPIVALTAFEKDNKVYFVDDEHIYTLETTDIINKYNPDTTEYYDLDRKLIPWYWKSQILPLGTINYSKKLIDTTFVVTDTDSTDEYSLDYKFKAYRKMVSETNLTTIGGRLNYVQSTTKKTLIPRFKFMQLELSNTVDDLNNNKLRLVGLGLKYVLLEGLL